MDIKHLRTTQIIQKAYEVKAGDSSYIYVDYFDPAFGEGRVSWSLLDEDSNNVIVLDDETDNLLREIQEGIDRLEGNQISSPQDQGNADQEA